MGKRGFLGKAERDYVRLSDSPSSVIIPSATGLTSYNVALVHLARNDLLSASIFSCSTSPSLSSR